MKVTVTRVRQSIPEKEAAALLEVGVKVQELAVFAMFHLLCREGSVKEGAYDARVRAILYDAAYILKVGWQQVAMWEDSTAAEVRHTPRRRRRGSTLTLILTGDWRSVTSYA